VSVLVFDAGALIAIERNDRAMWTRLRFAAESGGTVVIPSTVLAQVWRGGRAQVRLSRALTHCAIAPFDPVARVVGELCGLAGTSDICDAHVALVAATSGDVLYTSDPDDLRPLLAACRRRSPSIVRC